MGYVNLYQHFSVLEGTVRIVGTDREQEGIMFDLHNNIPPPFSSNERFLCESDQQSLYAVIRDIINNEVDTVMNLLLEGIKLSEAMDVEINTKEIPIIVNHLNNRLFQHATKMNAIKYEICD